MILICASRNQYQHAEKVSEQDIIVKTQGREHRQDTGAAECGNTMRYIIYKITNNINNRYYIGRHATPNIDDGYMGSGNAIRNAILKYGKENFTKEIIAETSSTELLWQLEMQIVNDDVVNDPLSYNMVCGGKGYLDGLKKYDAEKFIQHQSAAGKLGGPASYNKKTDEQKHLWHSAGGKSAAAKHKLDRTHPFYNGTAAALGGKALKNMIDLWHPGSTATNKNQKNYKPGDCKKTKIGTEKYYSLINQGWLTIDDHKKKLNSYSLVITN